MSAKPRKLHAATIKRLSLETTAIMGQLAARSVPISAANDFTDDGRKGIDYSAVRRGGQDATGPERAALATRTDDVGAMAGEFMEKLAECHRLARRLHTLGVKLGVEWNYESLTAAEGIARRSHESAGSGDCANCGRVVSGSTVDRLREGRCDACRKYLERNRTERPRHLWGSDSIDAQCKAQLTHHGVSYRCVLLGEHSGNHECAAGPFENAGRVA